MIACAQPPAGAARWTRHLLADTLVKLDVVETIAPESVRSIFKKTHGSRGKANHGVEDKSQVMTWGIGKMSSINMLYLMPLYDL